VFTIQQRPTSGLSVPRFGSLPSPHLPSTTRPMRMTWGIAGHLSRGQRIFHDPYTTFWSCARILLRRDRMRVCLLRRLLPGALLDGLRLSTYSRNVEPSRTCSWVNVDPHGTSVIDSRYPPRTRFRSSSSRLLDANHTSTPTNNSSLSSFPLSVIYLLIPIHPSYLKVISVVAWCRC